MVGEIVDDPRRFGVSGGYGVGDGAAHAKAEGGELEEDPSIWSEFLMRLAELHNDGAGPVRWFLAEPPLDVQMFSMISNTSSRPASVKIWTRMWSHLKKFL